MKAFRELSSIKVVNNKQLQSLFDNLELDTFDTDLYNIAPFRQRKILYINYISGKFVYTNRKHFKQNVKDGRSRGRKFVIFKPTDEQRKIVESFLLEIIRRLKITSDLEIALHVVHINASEKGETNSPEGIHRDEFDVLIPCYVVDRVNIKGGASRLFIDNKQIYKKIIRKNAGMVINEGLYKEIYHDVEPIVLKDASKPGYRRILGVDINYIRSK